MEFSKRRILLRAYPKWYDFRAFCVLYKRAQSKRNNLLFKANSIPAAERNEFFVRLSQLEIIKDELESKLFASVFKIILILLSLAFFILFVVRAPYVDVEGEVKCSSLSFYTSRPIEISGTGLNHIVVKSELTLNNEWKCNLGDGLLKSSKFRFSKATSGDSLQVQTISIPSHCKVLLETDHYGHSMISFQVHSDEELSVMLNDISMVVEDSNIDSVFAVPTVEAYSQNSNFDLFHIELYDANISINNIAIDSLFFYEVAPDGLRKTSVVSGEIGLLNKPDEKLKMAFKDSLSFSPSRFLNMSVNSKNGFIDCIFHGRLEDFSFFRDVGGRRVSTSFFPSRFSHYREQVPEEMRQVFVTCIISLVAFLIFRQRKNL